MENEAKSPQQMGSTFVPIVHHSLPRPSETKQHLRSFTKVECKDMTQSLNRSGRMSAEPFHAKNLFTESDCCNLALSALDLENLDLRNLDPVLAQKMLNEIRSGANIKQVLEKFRVIDKKNLLMRSNRYSLPPPPPPRRPELEMGAVTVEPCAGVMTRSATAAPESCSGSLGRTSGNKAEKTVTFQDEFEVKRNKDVIDMVL